MLTKKELQPIDCTQPSLSVAGLARPLSVLLLALGCGGSADAGSACDIFNACGGSLVGVWKLPGTEVCAALGSCDGYDRVDQSEEHGSITFAADRTFQWLSTRSGTRSASYPWSCLVCSSQASADNGISADCSQSAPEGCRCDYVYDNAVFSSQGTYSTSGGTLTMVSTSPWRFPTAYCVQNDTLMLHTPKLPAESFSTGVYARSYIYTRQ